MPRATYLSLLLFSLFCFLPSHVNAQGGGKGWIERFSGPGPFDGFELFTPVGCLGKPSGSEELKLRFLGCYKDFESKPIVWFDLAYGKYESKDDELVGGTVKLTTLEIRVTRPLGIPGLDKTRGVFEVSGGVGGYHFVADGFDFWQTGFGARGAFVPLHLFNGKDEWQGILHLWGKVSRIGPDITGERFGVPRDVLDEGWETVLSGGITVDLFALYRRR